MLSLHFGLCVDTLKPVLIEIYISLCYCRMMESGLLSFDEAKKVFERKQTKNKFSSPIKAISVVERNTESVTVKKKPPSSPVSLNRRSTTESKVAAKQSRKRKVDDGSSEDDSDDDFSVKKVVKKPKAK